MKPCEKSLFLLNTKQQNQLAPEEQTFLQEHLSHCSSCQEHQKVMALADSVMQQWEVPEVSSELSRKILEASESLPQTQPWSRLWTNWFSGRFYAMIALSIVLLVTGLSLPTQQKMSPKTIQKSFALIHGPTMKVNKTVVILRLLGIEEE